MCNRACSEAMRRAAVCVLACVLGLTLVACGDKTATLKISGPSGSFSLVMTGSQDTIDTFKGKVEQIASGGGGAGASVITLDGDQHEGAAVCQTDVTDNGAKYHVAVYSTVNSITSSVCDSIQQSTGG